MSLTTDQKSEYVTRKVSEAKKQLEINAVQYIAPIDLEPTKDTEIELKHAEIEVYREEYAKNPKGRIQYVKDVQPMKDALRTLQAENENIKKRNRAKGDEAREVYNLEREPLQAELEIIQSDIKTFLAGI